MTSESRNLTVFLTGATRGIGLDIARCLCAAGYRLFGVARQTSEEFITLTTQYPEQLQLIEADLGTTIGLRTVADRIRKCRTVYALINNAGQATTGLHLTLPRRDIDNLLAINLTAPVVLSQAAMRGMIKKRAGRIVNISSVCAQRPYRGLSVYSATKAGIEGFTRTLAAECGYWGITANCIAPGYIDTAMTATLDPLTAGRIRSRGMLPTTTTGVDVAQTVAFLLSPAAAAITAEVIRVDGGSAA